MIARLASSSRFDRTRFRAVMPAPASPVLADRPRQSPAEAVVIHFARREPLAAAAMAALIEVQAELG